jgi:hypothetical protein
VNRGGSRLASQFSKSEALADHLRDSKTKAASVIKVFPVVETENLLVNIAF